MIYFCYFRIYSWNTYSCKDLIVSKFVYRYFWSHCAVKRPVKLFQTPCIENKRVLRLKCAAPLQLQEVENEICFIKGLFIFDFFCLWTTLGTSIYVISLVIPLFGVVKVVRWLDCRSPPISQLFFFSRHFRKSYHPPLA